MKLYIVGVGLIGGSMMLDLKRIGDFEIIGVDKNEEHLNTALKNGIIDRKGSINDISQADRVVLSVDVKSAIELLPSILSSIKENALVWDVGSTKEKLCAMISEHPKRNQFLATHPIAGKENSGPEYAIEGMFADKIQIICESYKTRDDLLEWSKSIFISLGMRLRFMEAKENDSSMAYVSHLSHISSFMLAKTVLETKKINNILDLAGSGFESTVRLAKSSPDMWAPIFQQNRENVIETLDVYIHNLLNFKQYLIDKDYQSLHEQMKTTNTLTNILNRINKNK